MHSQGFVCHHPQGFFQCVKNEPWPQLELGNFHLKVQADTFLSLKNTVYICLSMFGVDGFVFVSLNPPNLVLFFRPVCSLYSVV